MTMAADSLEIILAHETIAAVPAQTFQTPIGRILARIEIFAVSFAAAKVVNAHSVVADESSWVLDLTL
jgi:hypothetical protein